MAHRHRVSWLSVSMPAYGRPDGTGNVAVGVLAHSPIRPPRRYPLLDVGPVSGLANACGRRMSSHAAWRRSDLDYSS
jgi:hypothetical protein